MLLIILPSPHYVQGSPRCVPGGSGVVHFTTGGRSPSHSTPQTRYVPLSQPIPPHILALGVI